MNEFPLVDADPGVTRQVLADHPDLMVVAFNFSRLLYTSPSPRDLSTSRMPSSA